MAWPAFNPPLSAILGRGKSNNDYGQTEHAPILVGETAVKIEKCGPICKTGGKTHSVGHV